MKALSTDRHTNNAKPGSSQAISSTKSAEKPSKHSKRQPSESNSSDEYEEAPTGPMAKEQLVDEMREEHGFKFKNRILQGIRIDEGLMVFF